MFVCLPSGQYAQEQSLQSRTALEEAGRRSEELQEELNDLNTKLQEAEEEFGNERDALKCQSADICRKMEVCMCMYVCTVLCRCICVY